MRVRLTQGARDQWGDSGPAPGSEYEVKSKFQTDEGERWYSFFASDFSIVFWANDKMVEEID